MNKHEKGLTGILLILVITVIGISAVGYWAYKNGQSKKSDETFLPTPTATLVPTNQLPTVILTKEKPVITEPIANSKITSPLVVKGTVPAGWMFEGVFPIKIVDGYGTIIVQGQAKEATPGSWQSGNPVEFTATLSFGTTATTGYIVLENDNPSGLPENSKTFKIPVKF